VTRVYGVNIREEAKGILPKLLIVVAMAFPMTVALYGVLPRQR
jgi:hypothetical protein